MQELACALAMMHAHVGLILRARVGFQKHKKKKKKKNKFSALILRFGTNPTSFGSHSKPHFFHYIKPYVIHLQNIQKSHEKNLKFTRKIVNQKRVFYKIFSSQFYLFETFSSPNPLSLRLLIACLMTYNRLD